MFKFLKDKFKGAVESFSRKVEEEVSEEKKEEIIEEVPEKTPKEKEEKPEDKEEIKEEEKKPKEKKGIFKKVKETVSTKRISEERFNELFENLEIVLLENNVAVEVIEKIKKDLKMDLVDVPINRSEISEKVSNSLKESIQELFNNSFSFIDEVKKSEKPYVIVFLGVNGSGKTTTIAKFAELLKENGMSSVIAASDTFRAAAIHQLEEHANKLDVRLIKHDYGADPAAVAFDARKYAESKKVDVVLVDTAGRLHSNVNLMDEVKKIIRVANPNLKVFVGESITGNDCVEQAERFNEAVGIDAIVLTKADVDEKGGAAISVSYVTGKPIIYMGIGQGYGDLEEFESNKLVKTLGL